MTSKNRTPDTAASPYLLEILRSDPLARILQRFQISPFLFGLLVFIYGLIRNLLLPAIFGTLYTVHSGGRTVLGVLNDWPVLGMELVMVPIVAVSNWRHHYAVIVELGSNPTPCQLFPTSIVEKMT